MKQRLSHAVPNLMLQHALMRKNAYPMCLHVVLPIHLKTLLQRQRHGATRLFMHITLIAALQANTLKAMYLRFCALKRALLMRVSMLMLRH